MMLSMRALKGARREMVCRGTLVACGPLPGRSVVALASNIVLASMAGDWWMRQRFNNRAAQEKKGEALKSN